MLSVVVFRVSCRDVDAWGLVVSSKGYECVVVVLMSRCVLCLVFDILEYLNVVVTASNQTRVFPCTGTCMRIHMVAVVPCVSYSGT